MHWSLPRFSGGRRRLTRVLPPHCIGSVFGGVAKTHDHDAVMRISGEAAGSRTILWNGKSQVPPRYTATSDHDRTFTCRWRMPILPRSNLHLLTSGGGTQHNTFGDFTDCRVTPQRYQQLARQSLPLRRQGATIIVFRVRSGACSVRALYHCDSALSFWNMSQRQASCSIPRRTRELPAFARPFSRRFAPLSSSDPVMPAYRATARRSRRFRQSTSLTSMSAVSIPMPLTFASINPMSS